MEVFNLDLIPGRSNPVIHCSQFDEGRAYRANLFEGASVYTLDGTETITLIEKKLDGNEVTIAVTNTSDSYVEFDTTQQLTALAGSQLCELRFEKGADLIGSANFILDCEESPDTGIASDSAIHNLEEQIAEAVADQYDSNNVIFDNAPTPGHGVGYCVTSEGTPDELADLTDVELTAPAIGEAVVWDGSKWTNGTPDMDVSDLADVTITTPSDDEILVYDNGEWVNKANPASTANFGADYDENTTYNTGDKVIYNNLFYECNDDGVTGAWDASKWDSLTVADMTAGNLPLGSDFSDPNSTAGAIASKADKTALTWTSAGDATGSTEIALPNDWNEAQVYGAFGGNANYGFCAHIIKAHLGSNPTKFIQGGADKDSGTDHHMIIWHCGSNNKIGLEVWRYNNTDYLSTSKIIVYYR